MQSLNLGWLKQDKQLSPSSCPRTHPQANPELFGYLSPPHKVSSFLDWITLYESIIRVSEMTCELNGLKVVFCDKKECVLRSVCGGNYKVRWTVLTRPGNGSINSLIHGSRLGIGRARSLVLGHSKRKKRG